MEAPWLYLKVLFALDEAQRFWPASLPLPESYRSRRRSQLKTRQLPIGTAKSKSMQDMKQEFLNNCSWKNCLVTRDIDSEETEVDYIDNKLVYHIAWFEDEISVEKKIQYLKTFGITHYSFWVWGYY